MHEYYHPSSAPEWVNDDWIRKNTQWDPETTPVETFADNGFYRVQTETPVSHSENLYYFTWSNTIVSPYCIRSVTEFTPHPFDEAQAWMLENYPAYKDQIELATDVDQLQDILNSIPGT